MKLGCVTLCLFGESSILELADNTSPDFVRMGGTTTYHLLGHQADFEITAACIRARSEGRGRRLLIFCSISNHQPTTSPTIAVLCLQRSPGCGEPGIPTLVDSRKARLVEERYVRPGI